MSLSRVRLARVTLLDPDDRVVLEVGEILVEPNLFALLRGGLEIERIEIRDPHVRLIPGEQGRPTLLDAIAPARPPRPEEPRREEPGARVEVRRLVLTGGAAEYLDPRARELSIADLTVRASARLEGDLQVVLEALSLAVADRSAVLLRFDSDGRRNARW